MKSINRQYELSAPTGVIATPQSGGSLTADKTYYYKVVAIKRHNNNNAKYLRSSPSVEVSATTSSSSKSIKIEWSPVVDADRYLVFRTPTSGDYSFKAGKTYLDQDCQAVKVGRYTGYYSKDTTSNNYIIDDGKDYYGETCSPLNSFGNKKLRDYKCALISASSDDPNDPLTFEDIYQEDVNNGWGAIEKLSVEGAEHNIYKIKDSITITGYMQDREKTIIIDDAFLDINSYDAVFGINRNNIQRYGMSFILAVEANSPRFLYFRGEYNDCDFRIDCLGENQRSYAVIRLLGTTGNSYFNNCKFYGPSDKIFEGARCYGQNIYWKNIKLINPRYGMFNYIINGEISMPVINGLSVEQQQVGSGTGWNIEGWATYDNSEQTREYKVTEFKFINCSRPITSFLNFNYSVSNKHLHIKLINPDLSQNGYGLENSKIVYCTDRNIDGYIDHYITMNIKVIDEQGNNINNAIVRLYDINNTLLWEVNTDNEGKIDEQEVFVERYQPSTSNCSGTYPTSYCDNIISQTPHILEIRKSGFRTYKTQIKIENKIDWVIRIGKNKSINLSKRVNLLN